MTALISIGLPVYNGEPTIRRAITSVLEQSHDNVEVVISDNASTDRTEAACRECAARDPRIRYFRQATNVGPVENFRLALSHSRGDHFMWLGDDDWLDRDYLATCAGVLVRDPRAALVAGRVQYYRDGNPIRYGRAFSVVNDAPLRRVVTYLNRVKDNAIFHGVMRRADVPSDAIPFYLGGDWLLVASLAYRGNLITLDDVTVHRDLHGASRSQEQLVSTIGLPSWNARFPGTAMTIGAFRYFMRHSEVAESAAPLSRFALASAAGGVLAYRGARKYARKLRQSRKS